MAGMYMILINNNIRAFFSHCFKAIFIAVYTYNNPIITVDKMPIRVIDSIGCGNSNRLKTNVKIQNPTSNIFDLYLSLIPDINILNPAFL